MTPHLVRKPGELPRPSGVRGLHVVIVADGTRRHTLGVTVSPLEGDSTGQTLYLVTEVCCQ